MAGPSKIEWTEVTWNPVTGCTKVSPGCDNCYAARFAERFRNTAGHPYEQGFDLRIHEKRLDVPFKWRKPRTVFVNSMSDLFHTGVATDYVDRVFDVMEEANRHTFQVLTKRSGRMKRYMRTRYRTDPRPLTSGWGCRWKTIHGEVESGTCREHPPQYAFSLLSHCWNHWRSWT